LNNALTIGTLNSSHIEICKNRRVELFPFDLNAAELQVRSRVTIRSKTAVPIPELKAVIDRIAVSCVWAARRNLEAI
jgi:hypothetical protein